MIKKLCPVCWSFSYSADSIGKWLCPICGFNLSHFRGRPANAVDRVANHNGPKNEDIIKYLQLGKTNRY